jgi:hypothetical protein
VAATSAGYDGDHATPQLKVRCIRAAETDRASQHAGADQAFAQRREARRQDAMLSSKPPPVWRSLTGTLFLRATA